MASPSELTRTDRSKNPRTVAHDPSHRQESLSPSSVAGDRRLGGVQARPVDHRRFVLERDVDVSGVSGSGVVAQGVWWPEGDVVALRWTSAWPTSVVFHDRGLASVDAVHGHGGATRIVWLDEPLERVASTAVVDEPCPCNFCDEGDHGGCIFIGDDDVCGCGEPT